MLTSYVDVSFDIQNSCKITKDSEPWCTLVDTGELTCSRRLKRVSEYLNKDESFCFTYGDGVSDINIGNLINYHKSHDSLATLSAVNPPGRFGALGK